jgi:hypothetical protein
MDGGLYAYLEGKIEKFNKRFDYSSSSSLKKIRRAVATSQGGRVREIE